MVAVCGGCVWWLCVVAVCGGCVWWLSSYALDSTDRKIFLSFNIFSHQSTQLMLTTSWSEKKFSDRKRRYSQCCLGYNDMPQEEVWPKMVQTIPKGFASVLF